ncbi:hypothetical protein P7K49_011458 [Saguinus oedipus]|uniref:Nucleoside-diphosphate kinase n=1 Tax=Saguinus oedipus TaxID=9490 RepID=A0ABQ9VU82_SAGOE|nr:hypothetical protein P7K49_011458 [Saguinus oedipus]
MSGFMVLQRNAGSSSDGTEDSDFSTDLEHTDSSESDGTSRRSARVTRSSARLSQSSQDRIVSSKMGMLSLYFLFEWFRLRDLNPVRNLQSFGTEEPAYSTRRVTRSQQQPTPVTPKKYPLRQTRSSGSETEQVVDFSDRETKNTADHDESPPRTPTGNAPSSESDIDISSPNVSHDESIAKDMSLKDSGSDLSHRPKRRRFHESYNFNMKCPTPGCNSLEPPPDSPLPSLSHEAAGRVCLSGPGAGKGPQCACIVEKYGYTHLSAGELLCDERKNPDLQYGELTGKYIKEGKIVPVEITISLLKREMDQTMAATAQKNKFLIDGFPRNQDNLQDWNKTMDGKADVSLVLFFDCNNEICIERCLERGKSSGRSDDSRESLEKRIQTYLQSTKLITDLYEEMGKVKKIDASKSVDEVVKIFGKEG